MHKFPFPEVIAISSFIFSQSYVDSYQLDSQSYTKKQVKEPDNFFQDSSLLCLICSLSVDFGFDSRCLVYVFLCNIKWKNILYSQNDACFVVFCCSQYLQQHICFFSRNLRLLLDWLVTSYGMPNHYISPYKSKHCSHLWFQRLCLLSSTFFSSFRQNWIQSLE
jgi:hypothetical protein